MLNRGRANPLADAGDRNRDVTRGSLPRPTLQFRLKAWRAFQRSLDPLAPPKPLRRPARQQPR
jgi:hypothetical protein